MRNVLVAVLAVVLIGALSVWFFLLREAPTTSPPTPEPPTQIAGPAPEAPPAASTTHLAELPDIPAVTQDATLEDDDSMAETISVTFYGVVQVGSSGTPVAGATVRLVSTFSEVLGDSEDIPEPLRDALNANYSTTTDADGAYRLELKDVIGGMLPMASITCDAPGYARAHNTFDDADTPVDGMEKRQDFFLKAGSKVFGRVTRADTGVAVGGARVVATRANLDPFGNAAFGSEPELAATSGDDGSYTLGGLEEGAYTLIATSSDNALIIPVKMRPRIKIIPGTDVEKNLALIPSAAVRGTVSFPAGTAQPEHAVAFVSRNSNVSDILSSGMQEMLHDSFSPKSGSLEDDGTYQIGGLEFGIEYTVSLQAEGFAETKSAPFKIPEGESPITVDLAVTRGSTLRGKAVYEDGKPAAGVALQVSRGLRAMFEGNFDHFQANCDAKEDGTFEMPNVPAGEYTLLAQKDLIHALTPFTADSDADEDHTITVDGVNDMNGLVVTVKGNAPAPGTGVITGTLLDEDSMPVANWEVHAYTYVGGANTKAEATTAADGTFRLEKLSDNEYTVYASRDVLWARAKDVAIGSDITLRFAPEAVISGTVVDAAGDPVDGCTVQLKPRKETTPDTANMFDPTQITDMFGMRAFTARTNTFGLFEITDFEPGRYVVRVTASSAGYGESDVFTVAEGESKANVQIQLAKGVGLSGTVVDASGAPIVGAQVSLSESNAANPFLDQFADQMAGMMPDMMLQGGDGVATDDSGNFAFYNLAPGDYKLSAKAEGFAKASDSISLAVGHDVKGHRIVLARGGCIAGTASVKGEAKAGLMLQAIGSGGGGMKQAMSGEGGRFELCGLNAGSYMVTVMDMSGMMSGDVSGLMPTMRKAEVRDGETTEVDFGPAEGTVSVRGTVHGKRGQITTISLQKPGAPEPNMADAFNMDAAMEALDFMGGHAMADANGAFSIDEVVPGDYVLEVHSVTIDMENLDMAEAMEAQMKPAIRQNVTVPPGDGLTLDLELPATE